MSRGDLLCTRRNSRHVIRSRIKEELELRVKMDCFSYQRRWKNLKKEKISSPVKEFFVATGCCRNARVEEICAGKRRRRHSRW